MICPSCQKEIAANSNFCYFCGARTAAPPVTAAPPTAGPRRLVRSITDRKLGGVCAGVADYLGLDVTVVRVITVISVVFYGVGALAYLIGWMVIPPAEFATPPPPPPSGRRLHRSLTDRRIGGVCGGVAEYFDADPTAVRLIWALSFFVFGIGGMLYLILWFVLPSGVQQPAGIQAAS
jgi:phage shock protein PspC (stress-responsive transcriptional regulator)